jgi:hypothetical protein
VLVLVACARSPNATAPTSAPAAPAGTAVTSRTPTGPPATSQLLPPAASTATSVRGTPAQRTTAATPPADNRGCPPGIDLLGYSDTLDKTTFAGNAIGGLSALVYDPAHDRYYSLVDNQGDTPARFYTLRLPLDGGRLGTPETIAVTILRRPDGEPYTGRTLDGEGMALLPDGDLLIASETEPSIRRFAPDGRQRGQLPVPPRFLVKPNGEAGENLTFESLALAPDGLTLYTAVEGPLGPDGFATPVRARLRLLRYTANPTYQPTAQFFYLTETAQGLSEIAALGPDELLTLERGFIPGLGNTIRLFRVSLTGATDVTARPSLADPALTPVPKTLLLDLGLCTPGTARHPGKQSNPLLDNIESVALGPLLPDGRQTLLLQSDDNFAADQVTRFYALAFRPKAFFLTPSRPNRRRYSYARSAGGNWFSPAEYREKWSSNRSSAPPTACAARNITAWRSASRSASYLG